MRTGFLTLSLACVAFAQRGVPVENEHVRVVTVVDAPRPAPTGEPRYHDHDMNRVMIYLDEGAQRLTYKDGRVVDRPVKPGLVVWDPKLQGLHVSSNPTDKKFRIVEVELRRKPQTFTPPALDPVKVHPSGYKVELDNEQVRIVRATIAPKQKVPLHEHQLNRVNVIVKPAKLRVTPENGSPTEISFTEGEVRFAGAGRHVEENIGDTPFEVLMVELK